MPTPCISDEVQVQAVGRRRVEEDLNGGSITSDTGARLLRDGDAMIKLMPSFAT
ncbi:MAG: hypothetical protein IH853_10345 [Bacteroidetes bacterium]|nr:hypothetical protein [Bacteroidota bacterium]